MRAALTGLLVATASCATGPRIEAGGPKRATFSAPAGLHLIFEAREERWVKLPLAHGVLEQTIVEQAKTDESYEPLTRGGYLVTRTLLDDSWWIDGEPRAPSFSQTNLSLKFTIDPEGQFIEIANANDYIQEVEARAVDSTQLNLLRHELTVEAVTDPVKDAWQRQLEGVCGRQLSTGDSFFRVDETAVTASAEIPIRGFERETVVGFGTIGFTPIVELKLEFGGQESTLAQTPSADEFRETLLPEQRGITPKLSGKGTRQVSLASCVTLSETSEISGEVTLPEPEDSHDPPKVLPFRVRRSYRRESPAGSL